MSEIDPNRVMFVSTASNTPGVLVDAVRNLELTITRVNNADHCATESKQRFRSDAMSRIKLNTLDPSFKHRVA